MENQEMEEKEKGKERNGGKAEKEERREGQRKN